MANEVIEGQPRIGWLTWRDVQGKESEPYPALLEDTGTVLQLRLPFPPGIPVENPLYRWWVEPVGLTSTSSGVSFAHKDVDRVPRLLRFFDNSGGVALVGCHRGGYRSSSYRDGGAEGRIIVGFAVLGGGHDNYGALNAVRTESAGLRKWFGLTCFATRRITDEQGRLESLTFEVSKTKPIRVGKRLNMTVNPSWTGKHGQHHFEMDGPIYVETSVRKPRSWEEHLNEHEHLLELASLSAWQPFGFTEIAVARDDDPQYVAPDWCESRKWNPVVTRQGFKASPGIPDNPRFLFSFADIGTRGVGRWLTLSIQCPKAIEYMMRILRSGNTLDPAHVLSVGTMLEELAAYILTQQGKTSAQIKETSYVNKMCVIVSDLPFVPFKNPDGWAKKIRDVYTSSKHADGENPDVLARLEAIREGLLAARIWIAHRLGADTASLKHRAELDPLGTPLEYVR